MPQITVWQCDHTGQLFSDLRSYRHHLRELAKSRRAERERQQVLNEASQGIQEVRSIAYLPQKLKEVVEAYYKHYGLVGEIDFDLSISYCNSVSNSHNCPRGGVTNWWGHSDKPRGYPGWGGLIRWQKSKAYPIDDWFRLNGRLEITRLLGYLGIHTGTGGGGERAEYDVKLFESDFPNLNDDEIVKDIIT